MSVTITPSITHTAHAKLILFGEYLAFFSHATIGIPLPWKLTAELYPCLNADSNTRFSINSSVPIAREFLVHVEHTCSVLSYTLPQGIINITSDIPINAGFGSSAALCVGLAKVIIDYNTGTIHNIALIWQCAHMLEQFFHNPSSGIDTALCLHDTPILIRPCESNSKTIPPFYCTPLQLPLSNHLVYGAVARSQTSAQSIAHIKDQISGPSSDSLEHNHRVYSLWIQFHTQIILYCTQYIDHSPNNIGEFLATLGKGASNIHNQLCTMGISNQEIDTVIENAILQGALGGKISGAGNGGAFFILCPSPKKPSEKKPVENIINNTIIPMQVY